MTEQESETSENKKAWAKMLLPFIAACPQVVKPGIGIEAFVEDLCNAASKFRLFPSETVAAMTELLPFIASCPHVVQPGIGADSFIGEFSKAAIKLFGHTEEP